MNDDDAAVGVEAAHRRTAELINAEVRRVLDEAGVREGKTLEAQRGQLDALRAPV